MGNCWTSCKTLPDRSCCCHKKANKQGDPVELAGGNVHLITTAGSWEAKLSEANKDGKILVANFSAAWCGPCRAIARTYSKLADRYPSIIFVTVDVDELAEFCTSWDINATPTFFFLKDGRQVDKLVGANNKELQKKTAAVADNANRTQT